MHRFVTEEKISGVGEEVILGKEESAHASKVLRLRHRRDVQLIDGENRYDAVLTRFSSRRNLRPRHGPVPFAGSDGPGGSLAGTSQSGQAGTDRSEGHGTGRVGNLAGRDAAQRGPAWEKRPEKAGATFPHRTGSSQAKRPRSCTGGTRSRLV